MWEKLAELMHEIWAGWMEHVFQRCTQERIEGKGSEIVIPEQYVKRWSRQIDTPYNDLSEEEKDSDREVADRVLALLEEYQKPTVDEKVERLAEIIEEARFGISDTTDISLGTIIRWLAYIEEDAPLMPADVLQCQSCGKPSSSLTTWTIDLGERIVWLCDSCQSTKIHTEVGSK